MTLWKQVIVWKPGDCSSHKSVSGLHVWKLGDYCTVYMGGGVLGTQSTTMSVGEGRTS